MLRTISLYTGVGGLDLGLEAAGFDVAVAVEMDRDAVEVLRFNRDWPIVDERGHPKAIERISSRELLKAGSLKAGNADLLAGGPPCQPFSKSGYWASGDAKRLEDPRADTLLQFLRILEDARPRAYLLENVPGLGYAGKDEGLALIRRRLAAINRRTGLNYSVSVGRLNAADFGVPQLRERVFVIGHRDGNVFRFPSPTHFPADEYGTVSGEHYLTAWDAIGEFENDEDPTLAMTGKWARLLASIPEGRNYLWHTPRGGGLPLFGWRTRYWTFLLKLAKSRPAWTLQAQPGPSIGPFHWKNRRLSAKELCRLQTLPDDYKVSAPIRTVQRLLGNAVPSALAELLGKEIRQQFLGDVLPIGLSLLPKRSDLCPPPDPPAAVPHSYLRLRGKHKAHPGTGLGPAAIERKREALRQARRRRRP